MRSSTVRKARAPRSPEITEPPCRGDSQNRNVRKDLPVQVSPPGIESMMTDVSGSCIGGVVMLYMNGCPYCEAIYVPGDTTSEMARLAREVHTARAGIVAVANGPRLRESLPSKIQKLIDGWPTILLISQAGEIVSYNGERTKDQMSYALIELNGWDHDLERQRSSRWGDLIEERRDAVMSAGESFMDDDVSIDKSYSVGSTKVVATPSELRDVVRELTDNEVIVFIVSRIPLPEQVKQTVNDFRKINTEKDTDIRIAVVAEDIAKRALSSKVTGSTAPYVLLADKSQTVYTVPNATSELNDSPDEAAAFAYRAAERIIESLRIQEQRIDSAEQIRDE